MKRSLILLLSLSATAAYAEDPGVDSNCYVPDGAALPDLLTAVPQQIGLQNSHQREILRFSNSIANLGQGLWWLEPEFPGESDIDQVQSAYQVYSSGTQLSNKTPPASAPDAVGRCKKGQFEFHPSHNHWHINNVAEFKVCAENDFLQHKAAGHPDQCAPVLLGSAASVKVTFCLIDWYKLAENTHTSDPTRNFFECATSFQGISPGWVDQYHQSTPDQQIDITGIEPGNYFIVTTSNHNYIFDESDKTNNTSWMRIAVRRESNGNPKLVELENACSDYAYQQQLNDAIARFTDDSAKREKIAAELCGNMSSNK